VLKQDDVEIKFNDALNVKIKEGFFRWMAGIGNAS